MMKSLVPIAAGTALVLSTLATALAQTTHDVASVVWAEISAARKAGPAAPEAGHDH